MKKYKQVARELSKAGCFEVRSSGPHPMWYSPITGNTRPVPYHGGRDMPTGLLKKIEKELLGR